MKMSLAHFRSILICCIICTVVGKNKITDEKQAQDALDEYNRKAEDFLYTAQETSWSFYTNVTDHNRKQLLEQRHALSKFDREAAQNMSRFDTTNMTELIKREIKSILDISIAAQTDQTKFKRILKIHSEMTSIFSTAKVCFSAKECLAIEPGLTGLFAKSRDYDRLLKAWVGWRDESGKKMKDLYSEFVRLGNEALAIAGHSDAGEYWRSVYEMDGFEDEVKRLFEQVRPLYEQLHAYVRRKLKAIYGADKFPSSGHIPAHLLGDMWAIQWHSLAKDLMPFKNKHSMDVTDEMVKQNYTASKIFRTADDFYKSLGLIKMPQEFWEKSMLEKPTDGREVECHASAWDFFNKKDFRIKQCTQVTQSHFEIAHHEVGHIEYYLQYKDLPVKFRDGANPGFHQAVGGMVSLSVQTPEHMHTLGLLKELKDDNEADINFLMNMALQKIAFLPFGYLVDQWRWSVFRGDTKPDDYTKHWWALRCKYQGVNPPVARSSSDFDPGATYHIPHNDPYIRYFVSFVIQFQFHKAACDIAGNRRPLHRCDIYNNTAAGKAIGDMLKLGSSRPWQVAMEKLTGQRSMSVQPLMEYFDPLLKFLKKENGNDIGWKPECPNLSIGVAIPSIFLMAFAIIMNLIYFSC